MGKQQPKNHRLTQLLCYPTTIMTIRQQAKTLAYGTKGLSQENETRKKENAAILKSYNKMASKEYLIKIALEKQLADANSSCKHIVNQEILAPTIGTFNS